MIASRDCVDDGSEVEDASQPYGVGDKNSSRKLSNPKNKHEKSKVLKRVVTQKKKLKKWQITCLTLVLVLPPILAVCAYFALKDVTKSEYVCETNPIYFQTNYIDDDSLELGIEQVDQEGSNGEKEICYNEVANFLDGRLIRKDDKTEEETLAKVDKIVRKGSRKWQYMLCSDGGYRYFTDEQFADPNTGFTHASTDFCAENGQGAMVGLYDNIQSLQTQSAANYIPVTPISTYSPTYTDTYSPSSPPQSTAQSWSASKTPEEEAAEELRKQQDRLFAKNQCQSKAIRARDSFLSSAGAMGAGGDSSVIYGAQEVFDNTYYECMRSYGY